MFPHLTRRSQHIPMTQCPLQHPMFPAGPPRGQHVALPWQHCGANGAGQHLRGPPAFGQHVPLGDGMKLPSETQHSSVAALHTVALCGQHVSVVVL